MPVGAQAAERAQWGAGIEIRRRPTVIPGQGFLPPCSAEDVHGCP